MATLVYIIVPVYNVGKYLSRCLDSIFNQTYKNIRVIVVNDGSTDSSARILRRFEEEHHNIVIINKENGGLSSARNAGIQTIKDFNDAYVMFVDSDDYISLDYVESLSKLLKDNDCDIVCSNHWWFDTPMCEEKHFFKDCSSIDIMSSVEACKRLFNGDIQSHIPTKLYKASLWKNTLFDETVRFMEDQRLAFKLFLKSNKIVYADYPGYYYYSFPGSLTKTSFNNEKIIEALDGYFEAIKYMCPLEGKEELVKCAQDCFASAYLMLFPRFSKRKASSDELASYLFYKHYVYDNHIVKNASFTKKKEKRKRKIYLFSPFLYCIIYRVHIFMKEKKE